MKMERKSGRHEEMGKTERRKRERERERADLRSEARVCKYPVFNLCNF